MKKLLISAALAAAIAAPTAASAAGLDPADYKSASKYCKALKAESGGTNFASMFGTRKNAHGKCVSQTAKKTAAEDEAQEEDRISAAGSCKADKKENPTGFGEEYGTRKNAFGKCVSETAREMAAERKAD